MTPTEIANQMGVRVESVYFARWLKDNYPVLFKRCFQGKMTLDQAACHVAELEAKKEKIP